MDLLREVEEFSEKNKLFERGQRVGVAVSGGIDSMCLLFVMHKICKRFGIEIVCLTIDHQLRPESKNEILFVKQFCEKNNIKFWCDSVDVLLFAKVQKKTVEQSARILRYEAFEKAKEVLKLDRVCLAHHQNDQAETLIMHISRGSGTKGLRGMLPLSKDFYVRPFLCVKRADIEEFAKQNKLDFVEDSSNKDTKYTRNYVRREVLPKLEKVYPAVVQSLNSLSCFVREDDEFIESQVPYEKIRVSGEEVLLGGDLLNCHSAIFSRLLYRCFELCGVFADVEERHISLIKNLANGGVGKKLDMPFGVQVLKDYRGLIFSRLNTINEQNCLEIPYFSSGVLSDEVPFKISRSTSDFKISLKEKDPNVLCYDEDKIPTDAVWRLARVGDKFTRFGGGTKSLKKYLTDKKVGSKQRKETWVCAKGERVLIVVGVEISDDIRIDEKTRKVAKVWIK